MRGVISKKQALPDSVTSLNLKLFPAVPRSLCAASRFVNEVAGCSVIGAYCSSSSALSRILESGVWGFTPVIPALRRLRQVNWHF
jgi:hypothetical protein